MDRSPRYYQLLEVPASATADEIKASYRRLARKYHPDINPDREAENRFKQIGEAYAVLSDPARRQAYDNMLGLDKKTAASPKPPPPGRAKAASAPPPKTSKAAESAAAGQKTRKQPGASSGTAASGTGDFRTMFDAFFKKDPGSASAGEATAQKPPPGKAPKPKPEPAASKRPERQPQRGEDLTVEAVITKDEAESGTVKTVNIEQAEPCVRCSTTGRVNGLVCPVCQGEKQLISLRKIDVRIPGSIKTGSKIRVAREGGKGLYGGEPGDLYLLIKIESHPALRIEGRNVLCDLPITLPEAVLGAEIDVPTLQGQVTMVVPPLTSEGKVFRLKGQGVPLNGSRGDQLVTVRLVMPKTLSDKERKLYEELAALDRSTPRADWLKQRPPGNSSPG